MTRRVVRTFEATIALNITIRETLEIEASEPGAIPPRPMPPTEAEQDAAFKVTVADMQARGLLPG